jgi:tetratricopeptide (TPR) repeat protein
MIHFRPHSNDSSCPAGWEITQALSQPETSANVVCHLRACPACAQLAAELRAVVSAAAELPPVPPMSQASRERIREALSVANAEARPAWAGRRRMRLTWAFAGGLASVGLVLCGWFYVRPHAQPQLAQRPGEAAEVDGKLGSLAKVHAFGEAKFRRVSGPPDETVCVESGRVAFGDGEVEVRGTKFEVEAQGDALWSVAVTEGKVDVRVGDMGLRLQAGDEWQRQRTSPQAEPAADKAKSVSETINRQSFDLAWSHLRRGEWDKAIRSFSAVAAQARGQALEEDALYWQAVATARAGRAQEASQLFEVLLQRFRAGARAGAATLALAWIRFDAGDGEGARLLFERAARDSSAKVREGADEGLRRLRVR